MEYAGSFMEYVGTLVVGIVIGAVALLIYLNKKKKSSSGGGGGGRKEPGRSEEN